MEIQRRPKIEGSVRGEELIDNNWFFLERLYSALEHADPHADTKIHRTYRGISVTIVPSEESFKASIIENVVKLTKQLSIKSTFSKSTAKKTKHIFFEIVFSEE